MGFSGVGHFLGWNKMLRGGLLEDGGAPASQTYPKSCSDCKNLDFSKVLETGKSREIVFILPLVLNIGFV